MEYREELVFEEIMLTEVKEMLGPNDRYLELIGRYLNGSVSFRNSKFTLLGKQVKDMKVVLDEMYRIIKKGRELTEGDVIYLLRQVQKGSEEELETSYNDKVIGVSYDGKKISPKTKGQFQFVKELEKKDIVFAVGPAGTGKTYLAVVRAASLLKSGDVKRIILTRPAVEAGESLGFLPGDLKEKVDPYLTPLYDALYQLFGVSQTEKYIEKGIVEIAPLAYMRGRTLDDAFIILDEAQNTTAAQMKMFLTRLGFNSKMVITGDATQIDLHKGQISGLLEATKLLSTIDEIGVIHLTSDDVVRHPLVQKIIDCYEKNK
ncbi:MAG: PhoH family protein [Anaerorhabdus sp.]